MRCENCLSDNPITATFCSECGTRLIAPAEDERRLVSVLIADIADFSALTEQLELDQVTRLVNELFAELGEEVQTLDGTIDKYLGDAMMVLFGAPHAHEDDAARALRCALAMLERVASFSAAHGDELPAPLALHISVNSGLVVAGKIGAGKQELGYSVLGEAATLAAQLERMAGRNEILVGETTYQLTRPLFDWTAMGTMPIRGRSSEQPVYKLLGVYQAGGSGRGLPGRYSPLVGRNAELTILVDTIERVSDGRGGIVALFGEVGLGKSRLLSEAFTKVQQATQGLAGAQPLRFTAPLLLGTPTTPIMAAEGRCLNYGVRPDYQPWQDIIRELLDITTDGDSEQALGQLHASLGKLGFSADSTTATQLGRILGLVSEQGDAATRTAEAATACANLFVELTKQQPLVIALEDLHWADQPSLDLLTQLAPLVAGLPILFILISRPLGEAAVLLRQLLATRTGAQSIELQPLTEEEVTALVCRVLEIKGLPDNISRLLRRAEGNPFFVEEIVRTLLDRGQIVAQGEGWRIGDASAAEVPNTLQGIIGARIDLLPAGPRRTLRVASVLGRRFNVKELAAIEPTATPSANLQALIERGLLLPNGDGDYSFHHVLTQEVAYSTLLLERRKRYHRAAAEYCAAQPIPDPPHAIADLNSLLNAEYHYAMAGEYQAAYELLNRMVDSDTGIDFYRRLWVWGELSMTTELLDRLATPSAFAALDLPAQAMILSNLARSYVYLGDTARALQCCEQVTPLLEGAYYPDLDTACNHIGVVYAISGDLQKAVTYYERALKIAEQYGNTVLAARSLNNLGLAYLKLGKMSLAQEYNKRALEYSEQSRDLYTQGILLSNLGILSVALGQLRAAIEYQKQALAIAEQFGDQPGQVSVLNDLGATYLDIGDSEQARACHSQALRIAEECGDTKGCASAFSLLGEDFTASGDYVQALEYHGQALNSIEGIEDLSEQGEILLAVGGTYLAMGDAQQALKYHEQAADCFDRAGDNLHKVIALNSLATGASLLNQPTVAFKYAISGLDLAQKMDAPLLMASAYHQLGKAQQALGDIATARASYEAAVELRTRYDDRRVVESHAALASLDE